jgi:hypothetical protein
MDFAVILEVVKGAKQKNRIVIFLSSLRYAMVFPKCNVELKKAMASFRDKRSSDVGWNLVFGGKRIRLLVLFNHGKNYSPVLKVKDSKSISSSQSWDNLCQYSFIMGIRKMYCLS